MYVCIYLYVYIIYGTEWLTAKELMPLNCGAEEDSWEPLGLQGDKTNQS